jgi:hypothetical protein
LNRGAPPPNIRRALSALHDALSEASSHLSAVDLLAIIKEVEVDALHDIANSVSGRYYGVSDEYILIQELLLAQLDVKLRVLAPDHRASDDEGKVEPPVETLSRSQILRAKRRAALEAESAAATSEDGGEIKPGPRGLVYEHGDGDADEKFPQVEHPGSSTSSSTSSSGRPATVSTDDLIMGLFSSHSTGSLTKRVAFGLRERNIDFSRENATEIINILLQEKEATQHLKTEVSSSFVKDVTIRELVITALWMDADASSMLLHNRTDTPSLDALLAKTSDSAVARALKYTVIGRYLCALNNSISGTTDAALGGITAPTPVAEVRTRAGLDALVKAFQSLD